MGCQDQSQDCPGGLRGRAVSPVCSEYAVHNLQDYEWKVRLGMNMENIPTYAALDQPLRGLIREMTVQGAS